MTTRHDVPYRSVMTTTPSASPSAASQPRDHARARASLLGAQVDVFGAQVDARAIVVDPLLGIDAHVDASPTAAPCRAGRKDTQSPANLVSETVARVILAVNVDGFWMNTPGPHALGGSIRLDELVLGDRRSALTKASSAALATGV